MTFKADCDHLTLDWHRCCNGEVHGAGPGAVRQGSAGPGKARLFMKEHCHDCQIPFGTLRPFYDTAVEEFRGAYELRAETDGSDEVCQDCASKRRFHRTHPYVPTQKVEWSI